MIIGSKEDFHKLAQAMTYFRVRKGFSQLAVAKIMGVPHTTVRDLETRGPHSLDIFIRYAEALGVELEVNLRGKMPSQSGDRPGPVVE